MKKILLCFTLSALNFLFCAEVASGLNVVAHGVNNEVLNGVSNPQVSLGKKFLQCVLNKNVLKAGPLLLVVPGVFSLFINNYCLPTYNSNGTVKEIVGSLSHGNNLEKTQKNLYSKYGFCFDQVASDHKIENLEYYDKLLSCLNAPYYVMKNGIVEDSSFVSRVLCGLLKHIPLYLIAPLLNRIFLKDAKLHVALPYLCMNTLLVSLRASHFFYRFEGKDGHISFNVTDETGRKNFEKLYQGFGNRHSFTIDTLLGCMAIVAWNILLPKGSDKK